MRFSLWSSTRRSLRFFAPASGGRQLSRTTAFLRPLPPPHIGARSHSFASMASWTPSAPASVPAPPQAEHRDIHTFSDVSAFRIEHVHLDWLVDWKARIISGTVTHDVVIIKDGVDSLTLDTSYLDIQRTVVDGQETETKLGARKGTLGSPLTIPLESKKNKDDKVKIVITYSTTKDCTALGWLEKEQTAGKTSPFLYSQCQAIHCRSMVPITDSPSHKILYTAKVRSSVPVLMSALFDTSAPSGKDVYYFKQQVSIPNYLLAIVGGDLEFRKLGPRTGVWAEKPMADAVQWEFERDAEHFLAAAEKTISPYSWTRYDSVVLPPSFPYGGMENANLTTLTPTLITGDRSLVDVLLHELVHSWSGNLTSCANWESFWLNEGWTVYWERLLLQVLHSPAERGFSYLLGAKDLKDALEQFDKVPRFQRLVPVFKDGEDPDDAFSSIPYEKGSNFLLHIEETIGGLEVFLPYARSYFHAFFDRSVSTDEWKQHLYDFFASQPDVIAKLNTIKWDAWLHGEGSELPVEMTYNMTLAKEAFGLAARWDDVITGKIDVKKANFGPHDVKHLDANQMVAFLEKLHSGPPVPPKLVKLLDEAYSLSTAGNCEIRLRFYEVALEVEAGVYAKQAAEWVQGVGRMKFARTTFRALYNVDKDLARKTFIANRSFYHPIAAGMIQKDLAFEAQPLLAGSESPMVEEGNSQDGRPLVTIIGATGTGKSQLAVELARELRADADGGRAALWGGFKDAECVSADSMQMYSGLDVITNKATQQEMEGVKHHLMDFLEPGQSYDVGSFVRATRSLCEDMWTRSKPTLPIVVGGTTYYIQHLLFPGRLVFTSRASPPQHWDENGSEVLRDRFPNLPEPSLALLQALDSSAPSTAPSSLGTPRKLWDLLNILDPTMAARWHWKDDRKVTTSLRVLLETGMKHSDIIAEQQAREQKETHAAEAQVADQTRRLLIWIWRDSDVLYASLDGRVDKMVERGLLNEIRALRAIVRQQANCATGEKVQTDYTRGIFQAIGYKEFDSYLSYLDANQDIDPAEDPQACRLLASALDDMKHATRQYARQQLRWIRNKFGAELQRLRGRESCNTQIVLVDATNPDEWQEKVRNPALAYVKAFLADQKLPPPAQQCTAAVEQLSFAQTSTGTSSQRNPDMHDPLRGNRMTACDVCTTDPADPVLVREADRETHARTKRHKSAVRSKERMAAFLEWRRERTDSVAGN